MTSVSVAEEFTVKGKIMSGRRSSSWVRALRGGVAVALFLLVSGDRGAQTALIGGIDPLAILKLTVKNNVAIVFDTSGSMKWPVDVDDFPIGGDDTQSRQYQAKQAVKAVVQANVSRLNFGLLSYNIGANAKTLNQTQDFDGGATRRDGPFTYVSGDAPGLPSNAGAFYNVQNCNGAGNVDGFFCLLDNTFGNYDGANDFDVFRSFGNRRGGSAPFFSDPYPIGPPACTPGVDCHYYLQSRLFRSNTSFRWNITNPSDPANALVSTSAITCPLPPAGLTPDNPDVSPVDGFGDQPRPCIEFVNDATGDVSTFFYTSAIFQMQSGNACGGALTISPVAPCVQDNSQAILDAMRLELPADDVDSLGGGVITANTVTNYMDGDNPPVFGVRADQSTPIAGSLTFVRTAAPAVFPPNAVPSPAPPQKNFVLVLSDGDDTCANAGNQDGDGDSNDLDDRAIFSARQAQALLDPSVEDAQHTAETLFVAFASAINVGRSNKIAQAGSGGIVQPDGTIFCPPGTTCRNAFTASNTDELITVLNAALDLILGSGEFSAAPTILSTVFELGPLTDPLPPADPNRIDPNNPDTRYNGRVNVFYTPTFEMPGFMGHLYAFQNDIIRTPVPSSNTSGKWDAGETLFEQVTQVLAATDVGHGTDLFRFTELHGGATARNIAGAAAPVIKRRILTASPVTGTGGSPVNRTYVRNPGTATEWDGAVAQGANVVAIWPPNQTGLDSGITDIDPPVPTAGALDDALGIGAGSDPLLTFADLRSKFRACEGSVDMGGPPADCDDTVNAALALATARKEARQILLTWIAGAQVSTEIPIGVSTSDGKAVRDTSDPINKPLLFRDRGWLLADPILGAPAIVGPPLRSAPATHVAEFLLFRDGRRDNNQQGFNELSRGFGLRNPDFDDLNPDTKLSLKPVMTVVYLPANDMLHAFRAGSNCGTSGTSPFDPTTCTESGGQEMWGFIPFDQLGKIQLLLAGQLIDPHTYMIASSVRVADIFIPGSFTAGSVTFDGRWRTVLYFGRGPGGKFYTALDVTNVGPFTRVALDSYPPFVMWNHGNEDPVAGVDPTSDDDYDAMGQSWSVPAVGNVDLSIEPLPEWRVWVGSGYGNTPTEGKTFYMLDAITGDVLYDKFVGDGLGTFFPDNALVASPSGFNAFQLDSPTILARSSDHTSRVYIPDIHGRIWKFNTTSGGDVADEGPAQPFGVPVALLKMDIGNGENPFVFAAAGNDERVPDDNPFKLFGYEDGASDSDVSTALTSLFELTMPGKIPGISEGFRGTVQPATAFNDQGSGRVFFAGTRFNNTSDECISSFDTILFGVGAETGNAVYDFDGGGVDLYTIVEGTRATNVSAAGGQVFIGDSGGMSRPPSPPTPPAVMPTPQAAKPAQVVNLDLKPGSPVCRVQ